MNGSKTNYFLFGSVVLILLAVALVAVLDKTSTSTSNTNDVRARAATANTLKLDGVVASIDEAKGTIVVSNVQFDSTNLVGQAKNLGEWNVMTPANFNMATVKQGTRVVIGVDPTTFSITSHQVSAVTITTR